MTITEITTTDTTPDGTATTAASLGLAPPALEIVAVDLYRDIHKAIRAELFALIQDAAAADPGSPNEQEALALHVRTVAAMLESHAEHEDAHIDEPLAVLFPQFAEQVRAEHEAIDAGLHGLVERAAGIPGSSTARADLHWFQLDLATFTADYLAHQDLEERQIMPALDRAIGTDAVLGIHAAIVGSIPPEELARSLALMIPAMNVDDRTELLGGIQATAPAEIFDFVFDLARSVLAVDQGAELARRFGR